MNYCHHSVLQHYVVTMSPGRAIDFRLPHSQEFKLLADNIQLLKVHNNCFRTYYSVELSLFALTNVEIDNFEFTLLSQKEL